MTYLTESIEPKQHDVSYTQVYEWTQKYLEFGEDDL